MSGLLLRQNSDLRRDRVWNWTIPASTTVLPDGRRVDCCPAADACVRLCYARNGTYRFPNVVTAHQRNLAFVLDDLPGWQAAMIAELGGRRFRPTGSPRLAHLAPLFDLDPWADRWFATGGAAVRVHDAGDFFSDAYTEAWLSIAREVPDVLFYAYTKEVPRFRALVEGRAPINFRWLYSLGGRYDAMIDRSVDRHADVFVDAQTLADAGYVSQEESDLIAVLSPSRRIGIPANNIPYVRRRMAGMTFGQIQDSRLGVRLARQSGADA